MFFSFPNNCRNVVERSVSSTEYRFESPRPLLKMFQHFQILKYEAWRDASDSDDAAVASLFLRLKSPVGCDGVCFTVIPLVSVVWISQ